MLHDFSFRTLDELLAGLTKSNGSQSAMPKSGMGNRMNANSGSNGRHELGGYGGHEHGAPHGDGPERHRL